MRLLPDIWALMGFAAGPRMLSGQSAEQARAVRTALATNGGVTTPAQLAKHFTRANATRVEELLQTLVSLDQAREVEDGKFVA